MFFHVFSNGHCRAIAIIPVQILGGSKFQDEKGHLHTSPTSSITQALQIDGLNCVQSCPVQSRHKSLGILPPTPWRITAAWGTDDSFLNQSAPGAKLFFANSRLEQSLQMQMDLPQFDQMAAVVSTLQAMRILRLNSGGIAT